jgi:multicomponent Na+:H+ antiporter subunit C
MIQMLQGQYPHWVVLTLLVIGLWGMLLKRNLLKKVIAMTIFQSAIILFFVQSAFRRNATVPIYEAALGVDDPTRYINPLPHTLMLTAIVVGVATVGVSLALLIVIYRTYGTLEEPRLVERMK